VNSDRTTERLALAIEHLQNAVEYSRRGRELFLDPENPDTRRLVEGELRKAFESLNRQGDAFFQANPALDREWIGGVRQLLTHDYADVDPGTLWKLVREDAPRLLRRLVRVTVLK
jgi:uncharacterized protein with HEPN domain